MARFHAQGKTRGAVFKGDAPRQKTQQAGWPKRISDNIAWALLVYTGLQIFVTVKQLKELSGSLLPYLALVILVLAIIPACLRLERRWTRLDEAAAHDPQLSAAYRRDQAIIWAGAIGLPFLIAALARMLHGG